MPSEIGRTAQEMVERANNAANCLGVSALGPMRASLAEMAAHILVWDARIASLAEENERLTEARDAIGVRAMELTDEVAEWRSRALTAEAAVASRERAHAHELEVAQSHIIEARAALAKAVEEGGTRSPQFNQGARSAEKRAVRWLHERAASMNDPHAKAILDSAAFSYGVRCKRSLTAEETG